MTERAQTTRRPPKPRLPGKAEVKAKRVDQQARRGRVTTAELAEQLDQVAETLGGIERALSPQERSRDVAAEEHALLNLVDAIVDRRTERVLLPLAHLATILDRLVACPEPDDQRALIQESKVQLDLVLDALGLERIAPSVGDESDPWLHEEVDVVEQAEGEECGQVARLVRPGVRVRAGQTLIPALVAVFGDR